MHGAHRRHPVAGLVEEVVLRIGRPRGLAERRGGTSGRRVDRARPLADQIADGQAVLGVGVTLIGRGAVPARGLGMILTHALALVVHEADLALRLGRAVEREAQEQAEGDAVLVGQESRLARATRSSGDLLMGSSTTGTARSGTLFDVTPAARSSG